MEEVDEDGSTRRKLKPKIRMLRSCCGLIKDQEYLLKSYTKGGLHFQVENGTESVQEKMEGIHWAWVDKCEVPPYDPSVEIEKPKHHKRKQRSQDEPYN